MAFLDTVQNTFSRMLPQKKPVFPIPASTTGGISSNGMMPFEDNTGGYLVFLLFIPLLSTLWIWMIVSKPAIIFHASQAFFNFIAMCCFASVAAFQAHWGVGPSGLSGFALFVSVTGIVFPLFLLFVPVVYEKFDKGARLARALSEPRVGFILIGSGNAISLLIAFITTISAWTEPGCKDASKDPHESLGSSYRDGLSGWCSTKKAGAIFFWLAFGFWLASLVLTILDWRNGKSSRHHDPPFTHPNEFSEVSTHDGGEGGSIDGDEESAYHAGAGPIENTNPFTDTAYRPTSYADTNVTTPSLNTAYAPPAAGRPSIDAYGAFSDPAPSGFGSGAGDVTPPQVEEPRMSRTMQYAADPYAAVRATIASSGQRPSSQAGALPPSYSSYNAYS